MADLISRAWVLAEYDRQHQGPPGGARKIMETAPAVDAATVVHGRWLGKRYDFNEYKYVIVPYNVTTFDNPDNLFCSVCNTPALSNGAENDVPSNYCPYCGAKMDGESNG